MREPAEPAEPTPGRTAAPMAAAPLNALDAPSLQRTWSPNDKVAAKLPRFSGWWSGHVHSMRPSGDVRVVWEGSLSWSDVKNVTTSIMGADEAERDGIAVQVDAAPHSPSTTPAAAATAAPRTAAATASAAPVASAAPAAVTAAAVAAPRSRQVAPQSEAKTSARFRSASTRAAGAAPARADRRHRDGRCAPLAQRWSVRVPDFGGRGSAYHRAARRQSLSGADEHAESICGLNQPRW